MTILPLSRTLRSGAMSPTKSFIHYRDEKKLRYKEKRWDSKKMIDSGGMPSSHSSTVTALAVAIVYMKGQEGQHLRLQLSWHVLYVLSNQIMFIVHIYFPCGVADFFPCFVLY